MLSEKSLTLDHLCFSTQRLDLSDSARAERVCLNGELLGQFPVSKDLHTVSRIFDDTGFLQSLNRNYGIVIEYFQRADIDRFDVQGISICKPSLGNTSV